MNESTEEMQRRTVLQVALSARGVSAWATPSPTGRPGDFEFLAGEWKIKHQRLNAGEWDHFEGEATVRSILGGIGSVEELRIPARHFSGMGLRLLDVQRKLWADYWVSSKDGVLTPPPSWGSFVDGVGTWDSIEEDANGKPVIWRGVWDQITPTSCRWYQQSSDDGGRSWKDTWFMAWTRA